MSKNLQFSGLLVLFLLLLLFSLWLYKHKVLSDKFSENSEIKKLWKREIRKNNHSKMINNSS